jgi:hypothetical protein
MTTISPRWRKPLTEYLRCRVWLRHLIANTVKVFATARSAPVGHGPLPAANIGVRLSGPLRTYFTLFIHARIGPVTLVSDVSGDMTSEMWL